MSTWLCIWFQYSVVAVVANTYKFVFSMECDRSRILFIEDMFSRRLNNLNKRKDKKEQTQNKNTFVLQNFNSDRLNMPKTINYARGEGSLMSE